MKKEQIKFRNWNLLIGKRFLKAKIENSLLNDDLVVTTSKDDAVVLTLDEAVECQKKIMATYPGLTLTIDLASIRF